MKFLGLPLCVFVPGAPRVGFLLYASGCFVLSRPLFYAKGRDFDETSLLLFFMRPEHLVFSGAFLNCPGALFADLLQLARLHVIDEAAHGNMFWDKGVGLDPRHLPPHVAGYVLEGMEVDRGNRRASRLLF